MAGKKVVAKGVVKLGLHVANGATPERMEITVASHNRLNGKNSYKPNEVYREMWDRGIMGCWAYTALPISHSVYASIIPTFDRDEEDTRKWQNRAGDFIISMPMVYFNSELQDLVRGRHAAHKPRLILPAWLYSKGTLQIRRLGNKDIFNA